MKIAVFGGSRFTGAALINELFQNYPIDTIHILNRGVSKDAIDFGQWPGKIVKHAVDRKIINAFSEKVNKIAADNIDAVIDFSGYTKEQIIPAIKAFSKKIKHYIFISTGSVYGNLKQLPASELHPLDNTEQNCQYGRDKIECENELLKAHKNGDFNVTIFRPTYIYGPNDYTMRFFYFIDKIHKGSPVLIPAERDFIFNAVYVNDLAKQIRLGLFNSSFYGEAFNAAAGESIKFSELLNLTGKALSKEVNIKYVSAGEFEKMSPDAAFPYDTGDLDFDCSKMKATLGKTKFPFTPYENAVRETVQWHFDRRDIIR
ncbi:MAG: NAD-dependent epimerase/dehydratase family protein [Candidatus Wallbacteria bacterium]